MIMSIFNKVVELDTMNTLKLCFQTDESMGKETITPVPQEKSTMEDTETTETPVVPPITDEIIFVRGCAGSK